MINFLANDNVFASFIFDGALFQIFPAFMMKLCSPIFVLALSFSSLVDVVLSALVRLFSTVLPGTIFVGYFSMFMAFQVSINFTSAANWFIKGNLCFSNILDIETLSLILTPSNILNSLFWAS